jgi:hypothetical protein
MKPDGTCRQRHATDPADKATVYAQFGLSLKYNPSAARVNVTARPLSDMYVEKCPRRDLNPHALLGH